VKVITVLAGLMVAFSLSLGLPTSVYAGMEDYCAVPPFVGGAIEPNVLVVLDRSGSMRWAAYNPRADRRGICGYATDCGWTYTGEEEGYFDPDKIYRYDSSSRTWIEVGEWPTTSPNMPPNPPYSDGYKTATSDPTDRCPKTRRGIGHYMDDGYTYKGSCLNFHLMTRIDVARWALTGGRPTGCNSRTDPDCDPDIRCAGQDHCDLDLYFYYDYYSYGVDYGYVKVPRERINGLAQQMAALDVKPRAGLLFFSRYWYDGEWRYVYHHKVFVGDYPDGGNADPDYPYTYFKRYINYIGATGGTPSGPAMWEAYDYFAQSDDHNYGGFDGDDIAPGTYKDPLYRCDHEGNNCQLFWCAKNFVILLSDGQFNTPDCDINEGFEDNSADPVVPAYKMHTQTLRTLTDPSGRSHEVKVDKVYTIGVFLGGTGEHSLKNVAMYGSFDPDVAGGNWPGGTSGYPMDSCGPIDDCCSEGGCGAGSPCTPLPSTHSDWDSDGDGEPDAFFSAQNASQLRDALETVLMEITRQVAAGSAVSVLSQEVEHGANLLQAAFYPQKVFLTRDSVNWVGFLYNWWIYRGFEAEKINIREDTAHDSTLKLQQDYVIVFVFDGNQLKIQAYKDTDGDGAPDSLETTYNSLDEAHPVWEAGEMLKMRDPDERLIYTNIGGLTAFTLSNWDSINDFLGSEYVDGVYDQADTEELIRYIRGEGVSGFRSRSVGTKIWKLGDIIYSTPQIVDYGDYLVVYVGANDGMLHAFRLGYLNTAVEGAVARLQNSSSDEDWDELGEELWAFIPKNVLPYLRYYADPDYPHLYYIDLSPFVIEVDYDPDHLGTEKVLIGGMRLGGAAGCSGTDCLNPPSDTCPDPSDLDNCTGLSGYFALDISEPPTSPGYPKLLWEFTHPDLGFSYSGPAVVRKGGDYYVVFLSGPTKYSGLSGQSLKVFVLDLSDGSLVRTIDEVMVNGSLTVLDRAFGGRLFTLASGGSLYFGYTQEGSWHGGVLKLDTSDDNPNNWTVSMVVSDIGPVTVSIKRETFGSDEWIFFGGGRYFSKDDDASDVRYLYGVKPDMCTQSHDGRTHCVRADLGDMTSLGGGTSPSAYGWFIELDPQSGTWGAERLITNPTVYKLDVNSGEVYFVTMQPNTHPCEFGGQSYIWRIDATTGGAPDSEMPGTLLVQLSTGQILEAKASSIFSQKGGRRSGPYTGVPGEQSAPLLSPALASWTGTIIQWIER